MVKKVLVDGHYGAVSLNIGALLDGRNDLEVICLEDKTAFTPEQRVNLLNTADIVILCQSAQTVTETLPLIKNSATKVLDTSNAYRLAPSWAYGLPELSPEALAAAKPVVDACPAGTEDLPVRWAALLMSLGEDGTRKALKRLRCSNTCIEQTAVLVRGMGGSGGRFLLGHEKGHSIALPTACGSRVPPQRIICFGNCRPAIPSRAFLFCAFSIAHFKGTRRTNRRDFCGQSAERSKKFLYNLDKLPHSVINLGLYDVRSYFMSLK